MTPIDPRRSKPAALFIAADLPWPPDGGGRIATLRILEAMSSLFEVDLVALADPSGRVDLSHLTSICRSVEVVRHPFTFGRHPLRQSLVLARSLLGAEPYRLRKFRSQPLADAVRARTHERDYALVHCDQLGAAMYASPGTPATVAHHNVESEIYRLAARNERDPFRRAWARREARRLGRSEAGILSRFDRIFVLAREDADLLAAMGLPAPIPLPMPAPSPLPPHAPQPEPRILTLGSMSWYGVTDGLLWFHSNVLPLIAAKRPDVQWDLVGSNPPRAIRRLARTGIGVHGRVDDVSPWVDRSRVAVVPLRIAGGIRMKLLDVFAWGLPAVTTSIGARGLAFTDGEGAFRADDAGLFAERVLALLNDDRLWAETAQKGQDYIRVHHSRGSLETAIGNAVAGLLARDTAQGSVL